MVFNPFHMPVFHLYLFCVEGSVQIFYAFFQSGSFIIDFWALFLYSVYVSCDYFPLSVWPAFYFKRYLLRIKCFNLINFLSLMACDFHVLSKQPSPNPVAKILLYAFLLEVLQSSPLHLGLYSILTDKCLSLEPGEGQGLFLYIWMLFPLYQHSPYNLCQIISESRTAGFPGGHIILIEE